MRAPIDRPSLLWRAFVIVGIGTLKVLALSDRAWSWWEREVTDAVPRSVVRGVVGATAAVHVVEGVAAHRAAAGLEHRGAWTRTTLLYGYPALARTRRAARAQPPS